MKIDPKWKRGEPVIRWHNGRKVVVGYVDGDTYRSVRKNGTKYQTIPSWPINLDILMDEAKDVTYIEILDKENMIEWHSTRQAYIKSRLEIDWGKHGKQKLVPESKMSRIDPRQPLLL